MGSNTIDKRFHTAGAEVIDLFQNLVTLAQTSDADVVFKLILVNSTQQDCSIHIILQKAGSEAYGEREALLSPISHAIDTPLTGIIVCHRRSRRETLGRRAGVGRLAGGDNERPGVVGHH